MAFPEIVTPELHVHDPPGTSTVSPFWAVLMAACTAELLQLVALMVAASEADTET
jgi:hypothetical protein